MTYAVAAQSAGSGNWGRVRKRSRGGADHLERPLVIANCGFIRRRRRRRRRGSESPGPRLIPCWSVRHLILWCFRRRLRTLRYVNAGHNPPIVIRRDHSITQFEASGPPVGIFSDSTYQESSIQLRSGDLVVAYTDGIVEATKRAGEEWGAPGIITAVAKSNVQCTDDIVDAILASLDEFSRGRQFDDATAAVLRVD
jgi:hypothetical protein